MARPALAATALRATARGNQIVATHADRFVWHWYATPERRNELRAQAVARFIDDITSRPHAYLAARLPWLPIRDRAAQLVLSSHLLFTWSDELGVDWHRAALAEMLRVTRREVRVFPLVVQRTAEPVPFLGQLVDELRTGGCQVTLRDVAYEFQRGARTMLVMSHQR